MLKLFLVAIRRTAEFREDTLNRGRVITTGKFFQYGGFDLEL